MKRKQAHTELQATLKSAIALLREEQQLLRQHRAEINDAARLVRRIDPNAYIYASGKRVYLSLTVGNLDGFRAPKLIRALEKLDSALGLTFASRDFPESSAREFTASSPTSLFYVTLYARLSDAPKHCQRIQVGSHFVEKPVYELRCD